ncbi:MAG: hypothetical protein K8963_09900, partial [Proteobacteria bacterium]|nr:hypothetical protein [Pseudomonadota bacterium]
MRTIIYYLTALVLSANLVSCGGSASTDPATPQPGPDSNLAPVAEAGADQQASPSSTVSLDGSASQDRDGEIRSYSWRQTSGTPVSFDSTDSAMATFEVPANASSGQTLVFELSVVDDDGTKAADTVTITVSAGVQPNADPQASAGSDQSVGATDVVVLDSSQSRDSDGQITVYLWRQTDGTGVQLSDAAAASPTFSTDPVDDEGEALVFELTVEDDRGATATDSVTITVRSTEQSVVLMTKPIQVVNPDATVTLSREAQPSSGASIVSWMWRQSSGISVELSDIDTATPTFNSQPVGEEGGTLVFELVVTDSNGVIARSEVVVTVEPPNQLPVANAGTDQRVLFSATATLDASASTDSDGNIVSYAWTQTAGTTVTLSDASAAMPT